MIAALITRGHTDAYDYGLGFAGTVIDVLEGKEKREDPSRPDQDDNEEKMKGVFGG
jgi:hypothetical protein